MLPGRRIPIPGTAGQRGPGFRKMFLTSWPDDLSLVRFTGIVPASVPGVVRVLVPPAGQAAGWLVYMGFGDFRGCLWTIGTRFSLRRIFE